uniref:Uncharacterized protein n=1 Tax=Romanomermis culicivorax TaxID=13658 RepID=A0A915K8X0_ROMCU
MTAQLNSSPRMRYYNDDPYSESTMDLDEANAQSSSLILDVASNDKSIHNDFFNDFGDLFDDDDSE